MTRPWLIRPWLIRPGLTRPGLTRPWLMMAAMLVAGAPAMAQVAAPPRLANLNIAGTPMLTLSSHSEITIVNPYMIAPDKTGDQPAYVTIVNDGGEDQLTGVSCAEAQGTTISETNPRKRRYPGLAPMGTNHLPILISVDVPAHGRVTLAPGGLHFVLQDLAFVPRPGQSFGCALDFRNFGRIDFNLPVVARDAVPKS